MNCNEFQDNFILKICVFVSGSPIHCCKSSDDNDASNIVIPPDMIMSIVPGLERLVIENRIAIEMANNILTTRLVPLELGNHLGLLAHSGINLSSTQQQSRSISPLPTNYNKFASFSGSTSVSGYNSPNYGHYSGTISPNITNHHYNNGGNSGGSTPYNNGGGGNSPMHQIIKGISGLTTSGGGGSITRGTSAVMENAAANQPLDLSMDIGTNDIETPAAKFMYVPPSFYDIKPLNLSPAQQVRIVPTPPASPNLCIIQEENFNGQKMFATTSSSSGIGIIDDANYCHSHPQICLTDVQGSEITLVALSDSSRDSDDSLDMQTSMPLQGLVITEPSSDMPSITRGVGRKCSLENETARLETEPIDNYARRGSDKSLGFSDDSLSNDSNNLSPCHEPSASSGFKSGDSHSETGDLARLSPDSLTECRLAEEYYELPLPHECINLDSFRILEIVKKTIDSKMPPKGFVINKMNENEQHQPFAVDNSNLSLEYSGGLQIELQVFQAKNKDNFSGKGIKLRRISGDQFEYGKLCQQLISSLTV